MNNEQNYMQLKYIVQFYLNALIHTGKQQIFKCKIFWMPQVEFNLRTSELDSQCPKPYIATR